MAERMLAQFASNDDEVQFRPMFFGGFWLLHATDLDPEGPVQGIARFNCYLEFPDVRHLARVVRLEKTYLLPGGVPDTTINGQDYRSLTWYWDTGTWLEEFGGGLRESGSGQVFYYHPNTDQEHLLYDFDVSVGDSVLGVWVAGTDPANGFTTTMYVTGVDTIILGGQARKRVGIQNIGVMGGPTGYWWIQGIGGSAGLLETAGEPILDVVYGLECMSSNDTVWWSWGPVGAPGTCSPNGVPEHEAFPVVVGPNPGTGRYTLYGSTLPAQMIVLDPQGREVLRTRTHN